VPKTYEFEFEAPPEQVFQETLGAVSLLGFSILRQPWLLVAKARLAELTSTVASTPAKP